VQVLDTVGTVCGTDTILAVNPMPGSPGDYGGPTHTMPPMPGSTAIHSGDDVAAASPLYDQRGLPRLSGEAVDIGEGEVQLASMATPAEITDITCPGNGTFQLSFTNSIGAGFSVVTTKLK